MARQESIAHAKNSLSGLVNSVAHGRERVVLTSRGHPKAALVSLEDLAALEDLSQTTADADSWLAEADALRDRILRRRRGRLLSDSVLDLKAIREEER